jgi:D-psicose/D-tagatose/L-ribulose 3-epimerase
MKYSITLAPFRKVEPIDQTLAKLTLQGFDAVEMFGEPQQVDIAKLQDVLSSYNMPVCGITGMWGSVSNDGWKRKLLSSDPALVQASEEYVQDCVKMCRQLGGNEMNICLFADDLSGFDKTHGMISTIEKTRIMTRAMPVLKKLCNTAEDYGVELVLEPLNRYSTPYCATAKDAVSIARQVGSLGILLDTFHMNIEEDSLEDAIKSSEKFLRHTHFADNNRKMPGFAHIDFRAIVKCLHEIGYDGYASFEPNINGKNYEHATRSGLNFVKQIEADMLNAAAA